MTYESQRYKKKHPKRELNGEKESRKTLLHSDLLGAVSPLRLHSSQGFGRCISGFLYATV